jgi:hypothetical protein
VFSDSSGTAETDRHLIAVDDHRHGAAAVGVAQHPLEIGGLLLDVDVFERNMPPFIVVTGGSSVGSSVLAVDRDHPSIVRGQTPTRRMWGSDPFMTHGGV